MQRNEVLPITQFTVWWRYDRRCTMRDLARELGVTTATIYYWLRGKPVPLRHLKRIEEISEGIFTKEIMRPDLFE